VVVIDDASDDRSAGLIAGAFPSVRLVKLGRNLGFGRAVGRAMRETGADWVFLLNNDLALRADFCVRLIETLERGEPGRVLAIGARTLDWERGRPNHGGQRACWRGGLIAQEPFEAAEVAEADFFQAGACLIDRRKFLELGGFAPIYHPGYWEDYDLAWQARRRGWSVLYEPRAVAYHFGKGSLGRVLGEAGLARVVRRNHLLFVWCNLTDRGLLRRHLLGLPRLVLGGDEAQPGEVGWGRALCGALARLPAVLRLRRRRLAAAGKSDDRSMLHLDRR